MKSLSGFRDFLPEAMIERQRIIGKARDTFELFGFVPLETPALEDAKLLEGKYGEEGEKLIFRVMKRGRDLFTAINQLIRQAPEDRNLRELSDMALRYDLTVPLARVVAQYQEQVRMPFKRYQIAPVWRADSAQKGRFREFYQCDFDTVGSADMSADAEVVMVMNTLLASLGFERYVIRINNRKVLDGICELCQIPEQMWGVALRSLDKLEKIGPSGVVNDLTASGISVDKAQMLVDMVRSTNDNGALAEMAVKLADSTIGTEGVDELSRVFELLMKVVPAGRLVFDPTVARGLDYYTGTVFETTLTGKPEFGSVMSGGRFDKLVGMFLGRDIPAVGASLGLDRLFSAMEDLGLVGSAKKSTAEYFVATIGSENMAYSLQVANKLRSLGIRTYVYPVAGDLRKQLGFAAGMGFSVAAIIGSDEVENGTVKLRIMHDRSERTVDFDSLGH